MDHKWNHKIFNIQEAEFEPMALELFRFQAINNPVYKEFIQAIGIQPQAVQRLEDIPFLPIGLFKTHKIKTTDFESAHVFESSGTTGMVNSRHLVKDISIYEESFLKGFQLFYGDVRDWCVIGLLPGYLERKNSSLVYMVNQIIKESNHNESGFYLNEYEKLAATLIELENKRQPTLLIGVTFALLDFAEQFTMTLKYCTIMETGGMKGRRKEMIREELHERLKQSFAMPTIHAEYGMTEMLSQAYSNDEGKFRTVPWLKVLIRSEDDPFAIRRQGRGILNIIDLANVYSCSFIATDDAGIISTDGSFEVLGRVDGSDMRGCSLLVK